MKNRRGRVTQGGKGDFGGVAFGQPTPGVLLSLGHKRAVRISAQGGTYEVV